MKLNLGCGSQKIPGYLNVDKYAAAAPDLVVDLEVFPWPWADNSIEEIVLHHVLEHLGQDANVFLKIIQEIYRVCLPEAVIKIAVPHPRHNDFITDPTHVRPISLEMFYHFDLNIVKDWQSRNLPGTPLALYLGVDFEITGYNYNLDWNWQGPKEGPEFEEAVRTKLNVIQSIDITLKVRKIIKNSHKYIRYAGMGDVCMFLAAAKAIKKQTNEYIVLETLPCFVEMAQACPHVDRVVSTPFPTEKVTDLGSAYFGICGIHEVDAFLKAREIEAPAEDKILELQIPEEARIKIRERLQNLKLLEHSKKENRVLLLPNVGDPNRTLPKETWESLALKLISLGYEVLIIGKTDKWNTHEISNTFDFRDLSVFETIALMEQSALLVSTDSGPIQLAGATDIGILGIYSVVSGEHRLPFRKEKNAIALSVNCPMFPCYSKLIDPAYADTSGRSLGEVYANWCPARTEFQCMKDLTADIILENCLTLL